MTTTVRATHPIWPPGPAAPTFDVTTDRAAVVVEFATDPILLNRALAHRRVTYAAASGAPAYNFYVLSPTLRSGRARVNIPVALWRQWSNAASRGVPYAHIYYRAIGDPAARPAPTEDPTRADTDFARSEFISISRPRPTAAGIPLSGALPLLRVSGNQLIDTTTGQPKVLRGVNRTGMEYAPMGRGVYRSQPGIEITETNIEEMTRVWGANVIRLPLNQQPALSDPAYLAEVDTIIRWASARGAYALLCLQWLDYTPGSPPYALPPQPDENSVRFWQLLAGRYRNEPAVLFDLLNEPHARPGTTGSQTPQIHEWHDWIRRLAFAIHAIHPTAVLFAGGWDYALSLREMPVPMPGGGTVPNVVYSTHIYPDSRPNDAPSGVTHDQHTGRRDGWYYWFGFERLRTDHPIFVGEWGGRFDYYATASPARTWTDPQQRGWLLDFEAYLRTLHRFDGGRWQGLAGWTAWAWGDSPHLVRRNLAAPNRPFLGPDGNRQRTLSGDVVFDALQTPVPVQGAFLWPPLHDEESSRLAYEACLAAPHAYIPFRSDPAALASSFAPVGFDRDLSDPAAQFNDRWHVEAPAGSALGDLDAMFSGTLELDSATGELTLRPADATLERALRHRDQPWQRLPSRVVYGGVDAGELSRTLKLIRRDSAWTTAVDALIAGTSPLRVRAGLPLVRDTAAARSYSFAGFDDAPGPAQPFRVNLSYYVSRWPELFGGLAGHAMPAELSAMRWGHVWSPATTLYVRRNGVTRAAYPPGTKPYIDRARPARSLLDAIAAADPNDTVLILDRARYAEGQFVIDKPLTVESSVMYGATPPNPNAPGFSSTSLPQLRPSGTSRVLRIDARAWPADQRGNRNMPVTLRGLSILGGSSINAVNEPAQGNGGGIAVVDAHQVTIRDCYIASNRTRVTAAGTMDMRPFKTAITTALTAAINDIPDLLIDRGRKALVTAQIRSSIAGIPNSMPNHRLGGQSFGGGVCFVWADGLLENCNVRDNTAEGRGAGVAVVGFGWPTIRGCHITNNRSGAAGRRDGGGIGLEVAIPDRLPRDLTQSVFLNAFVTYVQGLGVLDLAGIVGSVLLEALRHPVYTARNFSDQGIRALLYRLGLAFLRSHAWSFWNRSSIAAARVRFANVRNCQVTENSAVNDGGGLYASVLSRVHIETTDFLRNVAQTGGGGAVRSSMGSDTTLVGCNLRENRARQSGGTSSPPGGGGAAFRNTAVNIRRSGQTPCEIANNQVGHWAGGGLYAEATSEGNMAGIPDLWHAILAEVFGFSAMPVNIGSGVSVHHNSAMHSRPAPARGKGGGLYLIRGDIMRVADLNVNIANFTGDVHHNTAFEADSQQVRLVDLENSINEGDAAVLAGRVWRGRLEYEGD